MHPTESSLVLETREEGQERRVDTKEIEDDRKQFNTNLLVVATKPHLSSIVLVYSDWWRPYDLLIKSNRGNFDAAIMLVTAACSISSKF
jgi:hypothetical protein